MLEDSSLFRQLANHEGDVAIEIGGDNELIQVNNVAVVSSKFKLNEDEEGELMIVGPTRMQYSRVVALVEYMSKVRAGCCQGREKGCEGSGKGR